MTDKTSQAAMPAELAAMVECGYAIWATDSVDEVMRARFDSERIPVVSVRSYGKLTSKPLTDRNTNSNQRC